MIILGYFLLLHKTCCGYLLEVLRRCASKEYLERMFCGELEKIIQELSSNTLLNKTFDRQIFT